MSPDTNFSKFNKSKRLRKELLICFALFLVALFFRLVSIDHTPQWDEMYHVLAGRSWFSDGTFNILDGEYKRGSSFTVLVGLSMGLFGENLVAARLPSAFAGAVGVALLYLFTAFHTNRLAGLLAALLLCFHPLSIYLSQLARFYSPHALLFFIGACGFFQTIESRKFDYRFGMWVLTSMISWYFALQLQVTTWIGIGAVGIYFGLFFCGYLIRKWGARAVIIIILLSGVGAILLLKSEFSNQMIERFNSTPVWSEHSARNWRYYTNWMMFEMPLFFLGIPLALLLSIRLNRQLTIFCAVIIFTVIIAHSVAPVKAPRYLFYSFPFLFVIWGVALGDAIPDVYRRIKLLVCENLPVITSRSLIRGATSVVFLGMIGFFTIMTPAAIMSFRMAYQSDSDWKYEHYRGFANWELAAPILKPIVEDSSVLVSSSGVKAIYYFGRSDFDVSVTVLAETETGEEFGRDSRTGCRVVSSKESLEKIQNEYSTGIFIMEVKRWRKSINVPEEVADFIETHAEPIALPKESGLLAFKWG